MVIVTCRNRHILSGVRIDFEACQTVGVDDCIALPLSKYAPEVIMIWAIDRVRFVTLVHGASPGTTAGAHR